MTQHGILVQVGNFFNGWGVAEQQQQMVEGQCGLFRKNAAVIPVANEPKQSCKQISFSEAPIDEHVGYAAYSVITFHH